MSVPTTSRVHEAFAGDYAFGTLNGFLAQEERRTEILAKLNERFAHTPAALPAYANARTVICASNPYIIAAYNSVGAEFGTRMILPHELEQVIAAGKWEREKYYVDTGVVLDFSGRNHALALDVYEQLPRDRKALDALPYLITHLGLERADVRQGFPHALRFLINAQTRLLSASVLAGTSGYLAADDSTLITSGLPSRVFSQRTVQSDRYLNIFSQCERSLDSLGISKFYLGSNLNVVAYSEYLAYSSDNGRVVPVDDFVVDSQKISAMHGTEQKRTLLPSQWLSADGKNTEIEVSDETGQIYIAEGELANVLSEIEQGGKLTPELRELILRRVTQQEKGK